MKRRLLALLAAGAMLLTFAPAAAAVQPEADIGPLAIESCVTVFEDSFNAGLGDSFAICSTTPGNIRISNFINYTTGLHNGCNGLFIQNANWNDCISSVRADIPAAYKAVLYANSNYGGGITRCTDGGAYAQFGLWDDQTSSMRVLTGNC